MDINLLTDIFLFSIISRAEAFVLLDLTVTCMLDAF